MGNKQALSQAEVNELCSETNFSQQEIKRIYKRFVGLDTYKRGYVTVQDLISGVPEVDNNPLGERICKVFSSQSHPTQEQEHQQQQMSEGAQNKNMIDFKEFVKALSTFHNQQQSKEDEKLRFLFKVYDLDQDGLLSQDEIRIVLKQVVGGSLNETQLRQIIDRTCSDLEPVDEEGRIDFQGFQRIFQVAQQPGGGATLITKSQ